MLAFPFTAGDVSNPKIKPRRPMNGNIAIRLVGLERRRLGAIPTRTSKSRESSNAQTPAPILGNLWACLKIRALP